MVVRKTVLGFTVALFTAFAASANSKVEAAGGKPACDASTSGTLWPPAANSDSRTFFDAGRAGALELCSRGGAYRYHWRALTVSIQELNRVAQEKAEKGRHRQTPATLQAAD